MQRSIYTDEQLSVRKYVNDRNQLKMTMQSTFIELRKKDLNKYLLRSAPAKQSTTPLPPAMAPPSWFLANDFIQFLHFIDDTDADFELLEQLMEQFKLIDVKRLRNINIGSILMKMLHYFKRDVSAQKVKTKMKDN